MSKDISYTFGKHLAGYMADEGITGNSLAKRSGIPQKTIWVATSGNGNPTLLTAHKVCGSLGLDVRVLITEGASPAAVRKSSRIGKIIDALVKLNDQDINTVRDLVEAFASKHIEK